MSRRDCAPARETRSPIVEAPLPGRGSLASSGGMMPSTTTGTSPIPSSRILRSTAFRRRTTALACSELARSNRRSRAKQGRRRLGRPSAPARWWSRCFGPEASGSGRRRTPRPRTGPADVAGRQRRRPARASSLLVGTSGYSGTSTGLPTGYSGVRGESGGGPGVSGGSVRSVGVDARTEEGPAAIRAVHARNGLAGVFGGNVHISGDLLDDGDVQLKGGDLADQFELVGCLEAEPGTVVVIAGDDKVRVW